MKCPMQHGFTIKLYDDDLDVASGSSVYCLYDDDLDVASGSSVYCLYDDDLDVASGSSVNCLCKCVLDTSCLNTTRGGHSTSVLNIARDNVRVVRDTSPENF